MKGFSISTDNNLIDFELVYSFISQSYWAKGIPVNTMRKAIDNAFCFGVYADPTKSKENLKQVGFARMITDKATFAYLADVFILEEFRGLGLSKFLVEHIVSHPDLQGLRRIMLATKDAHGLYKRYGFKEIEYPEMLMQIWKPDVYQPTH